MYTKVTHLKIFIGTWITIWPLPAKNHSSTVYRTTVLKLTLLTILVGVRAAFFMEKAIVAQINKKIIFSDSRCELVEITQTRLYGCCSFGMRSLRSIMQPVVKSCLQNWEKTLPTIRKKNNGVRPQGKEGVVELATFWRAFRKRTTGIAGQKGLWAKNYLSKRRAYSA